MSVLTPDPIPTLPPWWKIVEWKHLWMVGFCIWIVCGRYSYSMLVQCISLLTRQHYFGSFQLLNYVHGWLASLLVSLFVSVSLAGLAAFSLFIVHITWVKCDSLNKNNLHVTYINVSKKIEGVGVCIDTKYFKFNEWEE